nr:hypothetical protein [Patescibacteria group bacterium]
MSERIGVTSPPRPADGFFYGLDDMEDRVRERDFDLLDAQARALENSGIGDVLKAAAETIPGASYRYTDRVKMYGMIYPAYVLGGPIFEEPALR